MSAYYHDNAVALVNITFNVRGEPIVNTPEDAASRQEFELD
jgi:predicted NodU family carbamoyl transferase